MAFGGSVGPLTLCSVAVDRYCKEHKLLYEVEAEYGGFNPQNIKPKNYGDKLMYKAPRKGPMD